MVKKNIEPLLRVVDVFLKVGRRPRLDTLHIRAEELEDWLRFQRYMASIARRCCDISALIDYNTQDTESVATYDASEGLPSWVHLLLEWE